jgi:di/tricarboxylate transporter
LSKPWVALLIILFFTSIVATFVSHTVASIILMPVIASIGKTLDMPAEVVIGTAFAGMVSSTVIPFL